MSKVNVFEVKAKLSEYLDRAARGEHIVICRHNKPVAELRAIDDTRTEPRPIGPLAGRPTFDIPPTFFEALSEEELDLWEGGAPGAPVEGVPPARRASRVAESKTPSRAPRTRDSRRRP